MDEFETVAKTFPPLYVKTNEATHQNSNLRVNLKASNVNLCSFVQFDKFL